MRLASIAVSAEDADEKTEPVESDSFAKLLTVLIVKQTDLGDAGLVVGDTDRLPKVLAVARLLLMSLLCSRMLDGLLTDCSFPAEENA